MAKVEYNGVWYDSQEELDFKHWLDEAYEAGLIEGFEKCEKGVHTFELIGKQHYIRDSVPKHCFASVEYTPDFIVCSCELIKDRPTPDRNVFIDVKGSFSQHNDNKQFQIIRKMMFAFKHIYVHKVVPDKLFIKTWVPELCRYTKVKGDIKKKYLKTPVIAEYLKRTI